MRLEDSAPKKRATVLDPQISY